MGVCQASACTDGSLVNRESNIEAFVPGCNKTDKTIGDIDTEFYEKCS